MVYYDNLQNFIGLNVCFHRRSQRLSQTQLAEKTRLSVQTIHDIEEFIQQKVSSAECTALADALDISKERLFDKFPHFDGDELGDLLSRKRKREYADGR